jgi:hypothetical protein
MALGAAGSGGRLGGAEVGAGEGADLGEGCVGLGEGGGEEVEDVPELGPDLERDVDAEHVAAARVSSTSSPTRAPSPVSHSVRSPPWASSSRPTGRRPRGLRAPRPLIVGHTSAGAVYSSWGAPTPSATPTRCGPRRFSSSTRELSVVGIGYREGIREGVILLDLARSCSIFYGHSGSTISGGKGGDLGARSGGADVAIGSRMPLRGPSVRFLGQRARPWRGAGAREAASRCRRPQNARRRQGRRPLQGPMAASPATRTS